MNEVTTIGIDLAKNVFELHGVNRRGKSVLRKTVSRSKLLPTEEDVHPIITVTLTWLLSAAPKVASLRRSQGGSITVTLKWRHMGGR